MSINRHGALSLRRHGARLLWRFGAMDPYRFGSKSPSLFVPSTLWRQITGSLVHFGAPGRGSTGHELARSMYRSTRAGGGNIPVHTKSTKTVSRRLARDSGTSTEQLGGNRPLERRNFGTPSGGRACLVECIGGLCRRVQRIRSLGGSFAGGGGKTGGIRGGLAESVHAPPGPIDPRWGGFAVRLPKFVRAPPPGVPSRRGVPVLYRDLGFGRTVEKAWRHCAGARESSGGAAETD